MHVHAECGEDKPTLTITDAGDGVTCAAKLQPGYSELPPRDVPCDKPVFEEIGQCGSYHGSLELIAQYQDPDLAYISANWTKWLDNMGLNGINTLGGSLSLTLDHTVNPIPESSPTFLPSLFVVEGDLTANEEKPDTSPAVASALASIPGFHSIQFVGSQIRILHTAVQNFSDTLGISCPPSNTMEFADNGKLVSFAGLDSLQPPTPGTSPPYVAAESNPRLLDISALSSYARCAVQPISGEVSIIVSACPSAMFSYKQVCNYIDHKTCPEGPT